MKGTFIRTLIVLLSVCSVCMATSIIFPAFDTPLVSEDAIFAHYTYGQKLLCLDKKTGAIRWQVTTEAPIQSIFGVDSNRIITVHSGKVSLLDAQRGNLIKTLDLHGFFFGRPVNGNIFSHTSDGVIVCQEFDTGKRVWQNQYKEPDSNILPLLVNDLAFLSFSPRRMTHHWGVKSKLITMEGTNMIACLSAKDGAVVWKEAVPLSKKGFGVHLQVVPGQKWLLCITDNAVRLLDRKTGTVLYQWHSEKDVDGADFWGDERIVICLGGIGATTRSIQIMNIPDFTLTDEFTAEAREVATVEVVGDVMILKSLYRTIAVDLGAKTVIWQKGQRHFIVQDGLLYYGEHCDNQRMLGICDPKTGEDTAVYSEKVKE